MPTIISHPAIALLQTWFPAVTRRTILAGAVLSILPDADVVAFALGIPYEATFGHRGFTHSILFAVLAAAVASAGRLRSAAFAFLFLCAISHPILDAMTTGGLGIAFFSPFSNERHFLPWRPIRVSPIGPGFFSARGLATLVSELLWVWTPLAVAGLLGKYVVHVEGKAGKKG